MNLFDIPISKMNDGRPTIERMLCELIDKGDITIKRVDHEFGQVMQFEYKRRTDGERFTIAKAMYHYPEYNEWDMKGAITYIHDRIT